MDDEEDFQTLFFTECEENLGDLQSGLDALLGGDRDLETVNAAFRAVHSVKGGAAAFGFDDLVGFAHGFETVMDRIRSGAMELSIDVCETLLRAADVMSGLVEAARSGGEGPTARAAVVTAQLGALVATVGGSQAPAAEKPAAEPEREVKPAPAPVPAAPAEEAEPEPEMVMVRVVPGPGFLIAGHDMLRMIQAARGHGLISVTVAGEVPPLADYMPGACPLSWTMEFELEEPLDELTTFLRTYAYCAEVTVSAGGTDEVLHDGVSPWGLAPPAPEPAREPTAEMPEPETATEPEPEPEPAPSPEPATIADVPHAVAPEAVAPPPQPQPAPTPLKPAASEKAARPAAALRSLRVDLDRIDRLVNLVGEVLIAQAGVAQGFGDTGERVLPELKPLIEALTRQTRELQESVMAIRAQPMKSVFARLPRIVRDLADVLGKEARLVTLGEDVEVDTTVIEELNEPLTHMIRNAMDHGLEGPEERRAAGKPSAGTLTLAAEQRGGRVRITLSDDGRGINREAVLSKARAKGLVAPDEELDIAAIEALIFHPGFSTAAQISAVSGRGVGMDVVRRKIQMLGGRCVVAGTPGKGTLFTITLPLTLAVMDGMAVRVAEQQFILPVSSLVEAITVKPKAIKTLPDDRRVLKLRGDFLPLLSLRGALSLPEAEPGPSAAVVVDTETSGHVVVLVDSLLGQRQVVLKSLEGNVGRIEGVGGATILGDGQVALVLDIPALFQLEPQQPTVELERMN